MTTEPLVVWADKDPDEVVRYGIDFVDRVDDGVTLSSGTWSSSPAGLTLSASAVATTVASVLVAGGSIGSAHEVTVTVTTSDGQTLQQTATLQIRGR